RLGRDPVKKLRDEVMPAFVFLNAFASKKDRITLPLDDGPFDGELECADGQLSKIQITGGQRLERLYAMRELNESGEGRAFIGLTDSRPKKEFEAAMERDREAYSTEEAVAAVQEAIGLCLERKKDDKAADTLLIDLPLHYLSKDHWQDVMPALKKQA